MRTGLIIADFEMNYVESFKHTARRKYNVDFTTSKVVDIEANLLRLKENIQTGNYNKDVCVGNGIGFDFGLQEVEHLENLISELVKRYKAVCALTAHPNPKIWNLIHRLREAETPSPVEIIKQGLAEHLNPPEGKKLSKKEQKKADADAMTNQWILDQLKKNHTTKDK